MHLATTQCAREAERKRRQLLEEELREIFERAFQAYGAPLENVMTFKYLERMMTAEMTTVRKWQATCRRQGGFGGGCCGF